jgi:hypothetical protein
MLLSEIAPLQLCILLETSSLSPSCGKIYHPKAPQNIKLVSSSARNMLTEFVALNHAINSPEMSRPHRRGATQRLPVWTIRWQQVPLFSCPCVLILTYTIIVIPTILIKMLYRAQTSQHHSDSETSSTVTKQQKKED